MRVQNVKFVPWMHAGVPINFSFMLKSCKIQAHTYIRVPYTIWPVEGLEIRYVFVLNL
jgi:hypothetical protein